MCVCIYIVLWPLLSSVLVSLNQDSIALFFIGIVISGKIVLAFLPDILKTVFLFIRHYIIFSILTLTQDIQFILIMASRQGNKGFTGNGLKSNNMSDPSGGQLSANARVASANTLTVPPTINEGSRARLPQSSLSGTTSATSTGTRSNDNNIPATSTGDPSRSRMSSTLKVPPTARDDGKARLLHNGPSSTTKSGNTSRNSSSTPPPTTNRSNKSAPTQVKTPGRTGRN